MMTQNGVYRPDAGAFSDQSGNSDSRADDDSLSYGLDGFRLEIGRLDLHDAFLSFQLTL